MTLAAGDRLGPYEITASIGAGGMGEVYRARDTRLAREVAIKILPEAFARDPDRRSRFETEARAASALHHPGIVTLFDVGSENGAVYLVSELVDGSTLRESRPSSLRRQLDIAAQLAEALAAAHAAGITHRDLKPDNIMVTRDGRAKILDFGLARRVSSRGEDQTLETMTGVVTNPGTVLGTVGYMAPEQARGKEADARSDIFSLGAVLYELFTGRRAFDGESPADALSAILNKDPEEMPASIPTGVRRIVEHCLEKEPGRRFQSAHDLALALRAIAGSSTGTDAPVGAVHAGKTRSGLKIAAWSAGALVLIAAGAMLATLLRRVPPVDAAVVRFALYPPEGWTLDAPAGQATRPVAFSADGKRIAFIARDASGQRRLGVREIDTLSPRMLEGTSGALAPFWSPDGRWIAFFADAKLKKIDLIGSSVVSLCDASVGLFVDGTWSPAGVILYRANATFADGGGVIHQVSENGGPCTPVMSAVPGGTQGSPSFLPDGRHFVYAELARGGTDINIVESSLDQHERTVLTKVAATTAAYAAGHLLFVRENTLVAQPFDIARGVLTGQAVPIVDALQLQYPFAASFSASAAGNVVYVSGEQTMHRLVWMDASGVPAGTVGEPGEYQNLELSPDARKFLVGMVDRAKRTRDVWLMDLERTIRTRFTFDPSEERTAVWSPDAKQVVFNSQRSGALELYSRPSDASMPETLLFQDGASKDPQAYSPDGRYLLYRVSGRGTGNDLWALPLFGDRPSTGSGRPEPAEGRKPFPLVQTMFLENYARFSPDGRWVAYTSEESGRPEVYVTSFPGPGGKLQVSADGGALPRWRRDGRALYYLRADNMLMTVSIDAQGTAVRVGTPQAMFQMRPPVEPGYTYDVTPDGRVLAIAEATSQLPMTVVLNWPAALKK